MEQRQRAEAASTRWPPVLETCTFATFRVTAGTKEALDLCQQYAEGFGPSTHVGIALAGTVGTGKTHLAAAIAHVVRAKGLRPTVTVVPDLMADLRQTIRSETGPDADTVVDLVAKSPLLVLDDLGAEKPSAFVEEKLYRLIGHRDLYRLPTIVTSNLRPAQLQDRLGDRIVSRLARMVRWVHLTGPDYRLRKD